MPSVLSRADQVQVASGCKSTGPVTKQNETNVAMSMDLEMKAAKSFCDLVDLEWPSISESVIWFQAPKEEVGWHVAPKRPSVEVDEEEGAVLCKTFFLTNVRNRLLELSKKHGVSFSPAFVEQNIVWPSHNNSVSKLFIPPFSSVKDATLMFINKIKSMWRDQSLVVYGFPSSNDFCLNILYTFGHLFEMVGLAHPDSTCSTFLFYSFRKWEIEYKLILTNLFSRCEDLVDVGIYSDAEQKNLHGSIFYSSCLYMNCILIKKQVLEIIQRANKPKIFEVTPIIQEHNVAFEDNQSHGHCCSDCDSKRSLRESAENSSVYPTHAQCVGRDGDHKWLAFPETFLRMELVRKSGRSSSFSYVEVSKFCSNELLSDWEELAEKMMNSLGLTEESLRDGSCLSHGSDFITTSPKKYTWSMINLPVKVLDFGMELWLNISKHVKHRRQILLLILDVLEITSQGECLEMRGFPLLSEFSVSLIYVLGHLFEKIRFYHTAVARNVIFFFKFRTYPACIKEGLQESLNNTNCVTSLVPLRHLFRGTFYENIKYFNTLSLRKQCHYVSNFLTMHKH